MEATSFQAFLDDVKDNSVILDVKINVPLALSIASFSEVIVIDHFYILSPKTIKVHWPENGYLYISASEVVSLCVLDKKEEAVKNDKDDKPDDKKKKAKK